jgi:tetratricopeptide (TPR) repeat protein
MAMDLTALARYSEAIACYRRILSDPSGFDTASVALYRKRLGGLLDITGDLSEGLNQYQAATALDEARVEKNPANGRARMDLSFDYSDWGFTLSKMGDLQGAIAQYHKAEKLREDLAAADPRDLRAATGLVSIEERIAGALSDAGERESSRQTFLRTIGLGERLVARFPDQQTALAALAEAYFVYGEKWRTNWSSCERALPLYAQSRDLYRRLGNETAVLKIDRIMTCTTTR